MKRAPFQACALACERGGRRLFEGVDFALSEGEALWLSGANGSGKTSLLRLLAGLGLPAEGEVCWRGKPVRELREDYHRHVLYCGHAAGVKDDLSAWENVVYGAALSGRRVSRGQAEAALARAGLDHVAMLPAHALSQGQRRRVALARLYLDPLPPLLLLDEPFTALDAQAVQALCERLAAHLDGGGMAVYTTHQAHSLRPQRLQRLDLDQLAAGHGDQQAWRTDQLSAPSRAAGVSAQARARPAAHVQGARP
ncbi:cytochrome c biogenesis heme-transporting ATPase CcmA [Pseudoduganella ginsengisoli]|uniref:Cytochrome c biogenesis heme-transporting ATPase CcmA n=1 Tax=Pseudoduganella ginsengisoli TaxID=1462440 RepID=A0A6L6PX61_9BURK|nr:cytochrome c biogenesis heme-transporting ATPase CcmA [Pseudoduganella ginsengisoli]MTW01558.1 cytochrome c biogenesis heme-transporting ATPase CcmA [Pseudoduganella ginsengisoli]